MNGNRRTLGDEYYSGFPDLFRTMIVPKLTAFVRGGTSIQKPRSVLITEDKVSHSMSVYVGATRDTDHFTIANEYPSLKQRRNRTDLISGHMADVKVGGILGKRVTLVTLDSISTRDGTFTDSELAWAKKLNDKGFVVIDNEGIIVENRNSRQKRHKSK